MENIVATKKPKAETPVTVDTTEVFFDPPKLAKGRFTKYTPELADEICQRLSDGEPLRQICRDEHMPAWQKIYEWMYKDPKLAGAIAHARDVGYDAIAEDCLKIADTLHIGTRRVYSSGADDDEDSLTVTEEDMLGHRKLQIETRLKLLAKFNPKKYGDKVVVGGAPGEPVEHKVTVNVFDTIVSNLELTKQAEL
jgi:hypothetical protein